MTASFISTGRLPPADSVQTLVDEAHARFRNLDEGEVSGVYPALARVAPDQLGICIAGADRGLACAGDHGTAFAIMSVSKPFIFALVCDAIGATAVQQQVGVNATGLPYNSLAGIEFGPDGKTNPMVNAGAIAVTSLVAGATCEAKWHAIREGLSRFAGRELQLDEEVHASASATNFRNRAIAHMLRSVGRIEGDPDEVTDLYTRQCSLSVTARDLAVMGATLAHGGVNPLSGERVVDPMTCHHALAVMITAGLYETSGDWLYEIGLPGKSGISGGIVTVSPGKGALATYSPRLDAAGNSVRGVKVAKFLSHALGLDMLVSTSGVSAQRQLD